MNTTEKILVIKLEDLTSFVMAFAAMKQIRAAHEGAHITLLTTAQFGPIAKASGLFNAIDTGGDMESLALARLVKKQKFDRVYDLEASPKTAKIYSMMWPFRPPWSGHGALKDKTPGLSDMHVLERNASLLRAAGAWPDAPVRTGDAPPPDLSWVMKLAPGAARLKPYVLMIPGGKEENRWPISLFGELAVHFRQVGFDNVVIGRLEDAKLARAIQRYDPSARDLTGRTDYAQIAVLAARAAIAVGNETSALHLAIAAGAPTIAFYPASIDLTRDGPRGHVAVMQAEDLSQIKVDQVARAAVNMAPDLAVAS